MDVYDHITHTLFGAGWSASLQLLETDAQRLHVSPGYSADLSPSFQKPPSRSVGSLACVSGGRVSEQTGR